MTLVDIPTAEITYLSLEEGAVNPMNTPDSKVVNLSLEETDVDTLDSKLEQLSLAHTAVDQVDTSDSSSDSNPDTDDDSEENDGYLEQPREMTEERADEIVERYSKQRDDPDADQDLVEFVIHRINEWKIRQEESKRINTMLYTPEEQEEFEAKMKAKAEAKPKHQCRERGQLLVPCAIRDSKLEDGTVMTHMFFKTCNPEYLREVSFPQQLVEEQDYDPEDEGLENPRNLIAMGDGYIAVAVEMRAKLGEVVNKNDQGMRAYLEMIHERLAIAREDAVKLRLSEKVSADAKYLAAETYYHDAMSYMYRADMAGHRVRFARFKATMDAEAKEHTESTVEARDEAPIEATVEEKGEAHTEATVEAKEEVHTEATVEAQDEANSEVAVETREEEHTEAPVEAENDAQEAQA
ncbi:hypothetical protein H0H92_006609 [Tricholoma furcatifolium]|nr:hypothetical protein H0H92_006609 [Tricholoma furcatifolium]